MENFDLNKFRFYSSIINALSKHGGMQLTRKTVVSVFCLLLIYGQMANAGSTYNTDDRFALETGWQISNSKTVKVKDNIVSTGEFLPVNWFTARVPSTVLAVLTDNGACGKDPYFGENLKKIDKKQFNNPWWYRAGFELPAEFSNKKLWLNLDGIIYKADIWLNGNLIADKKTAEGVYRRFKFNVTDKILQGKKNYIAIKIYPAKAGDLSVGFVDWNPLPPDNSMGIWKDVYLQATEAVCVENPQVITKIDLPSLETAHLSVCVELENSSGLEVNGKLEGKIGSISFSKDVKLTPVETKKVEFLPSEYEQLNISKPLLWWPFNTGPQNMYELELSFKINGKVSDRKKTRFGIREVSSYFNEQGHRVFKINGKNILIRGGGWTDDLILNCSKKDTLAKVMYARNMNLNTIRVEGIWGQDYLYDMCDENGIMVLAGWTCHWEWEHYLGILTDDFGGIYGKRNIKLAGEYLIQTLMRLRNHPSIFAWMMGSDRPPRPELEKSYVEIFKNYDTTRPYTSSAGSSETTYMGKTGVKMNGPYDYVPPYYYYINKNAGGAFGFATEEGPGAVIPRVESIKKMLPADKLWPINDTWHYHSSTREKRDIDANTAGVSSQYGAPESVEDYCLKSQLMNYDAARALFESWGRNKYVSTGIISWMYNSSWPSVCWQLFDAYLLPCGAFYGVQKACEPLHVQYSYDDNSVCVVNSQYKSFEKLKVSAKLYNYDLTEKYSYSKEVDVAEDSTARVFTVDFPADITKIVFLKLRLADSSDKTISSNFYCLSSGSIVRDGKSDILKLQADESNAFSPEARYSESSLNFPADFKGLAKLTPVKLELSCRIEKKGKNGIAVVTIKNPTKNLAFFIQADVVKDRSGEQVTPVFWNNNRVTLLPSEQEELKAEFFLETTGSTATPMVKVSGWNIIEETK